jgi:murein DD-endopeptidase MepM/ murein hydrolase activator NlpD
MIRTARHLWMALGLVVAAPAQAGPPAEHLVTIRRGDTLGEALARAGVGAEDTHAAAAVLAPHVPLRSLAPGQEVALTVEQDRLLRLEIVPAPGRTVVLHRQGDGFTAETQEAERQRNLARVDTEIRAGLMPSLVQAGLPAFLALGLVRALAHEVDFERDIQPGDRVSVAFERFRGPEGSLLGHGRLLQARLSLSDRSMELWRFRTPDGSEDWYHRDGQPLTGGFLRTPLEGARMSSGFGMRRHPVLGFSRKHEGVDFAAPRGTPVHAAADGIVASMRVERGYGRILRLRHQGGVETRYAHLARFATGLTPGVRVRQGDVIGTVGSSGLATGPHLHYEVVMQGRAVDPANADLPTAARLQGEALAGFQSQRRALERQIAQLEQGRTEVALAE